MLLFLPTRAKLLGFYFHSSLPIFGRTATIETRRRHILWLIENHPDSSVAGLPEASIEPSGHKLADEEGYQQARELWLKQVERNKSNEKVRLNAAPFRCSYSSPRAPSSWVFTFTVRFQSSGERPRSRRAAATSYG